MSTTTTANEIGLDIINLATKRLNVAPISDTGIPAATIKAKPAAPAATNADDSADLDDDDAADHNDDDTTEDDTPEDDGATDDTAETDEAKRARLQQQPGETDEAHAERLDAEGIDSEDAAAYQLTAEQKAVAADKARAEADLKKLPEAVRKTAQAIIDKRIGKITAKTAAEKTQLTNRVTELETQLAEAREAADAKPGARVTGDASNPLAFAETEDDIARYEAGIEAFEDWAADHADGYEPSEAEAAQGAQALTANEVRQKLRLVQRNAAKFVSQARAALAKRGEAETEAKKLIPAFFDAKTPEYQAARTLLREQPELKRFPDYRLRIAEIVLGRKALADLRAAGVKASSTKTDKKAPLRASRAPGAGGAAKGGFERSSSGADAPEAGRAFAKNPTRENLAKAAMALMGTQ